MAEHKVIILIQCGDKYCEKCDYRLLGDGGAMDYCTLFEGEVSWDGTAFLRAPVCMAAERKAKEVSDDDRYR